MKKHHLRLKKALRLEEDKDKTKNLEFQYLSPFSKKNSIENEINRKNTLQTVELSINSYYSEMQIIDDIIKLPKIKKLFL